MYSNIQTLAIQIIINYYHVHIRTFHVQKVVDMRLMQDKHTSLIQ